MDARSTAPGLQGYNTQVGFGVSPVVVAAVPVVQDIFRSIFGGGVSSAERAQHMANLEILYNQAVAGDAVALCRLKTAGGVGVRNGVCGGVQYGTFSDQSLREAAAQLYQAAIAGGVVPGLPGVPSVPGVPGVPGPTMGIAGVSPWLVGAGVLGAGALVFALSRRGRRGR